MKSPAGDADFCANDVRSKDFDRYALTLFAEPQHRRALLALYAFNIEVSRVRDMVSQPLPGEIRLQWWTDAVAGKEHGEVGGNPVAAELLRAIADYSLPVGTIDSLIEAYRFDLYDDPMQTLVELEHYAEQTDGVLVALGAHILGASFEQVELPARRAGQAIGIARTIRLLPLHASRRQLYLPADMIGRFGVEPETIFSGKTTPELLELIGHMRGIARSHLDAAMALLRAIPQMALPAFLLLALLRRELDEANSPDPFRPVERSRLRTLWTMWRAKF